MTCTYAECYVPEERHNECAAAPLSPCWGRLGHQHTPRRSRGGKQCHVMLCDGHVSSIDNGHRYQGQRLRDNVIDDGETKFYAIYDRDSGERLVRVELL